MGIAKVRRWQWVALSLLVGFLVIQVRRAIPRPLSDYGTELSDPNTFESAIVKEYDGQRLFRNLVVYPVEVDQGGTRVLKHFVTGDYFNGKPQKVHGRYEAKWERYCFVAGIPFTPMAQDDAQAPNATVVDYLRRMSRDNGVNFVYCWWLHPRWEAAFWMTSSFVVIGLIWPTCVNLLTFGTWRRPPEQRGVSLWEALRGIGRRREAPSAAPVGPTPSMADVERYDAALEAQLAGSPPAGAPDPIATSGTAVAVAPQPGRLTTAPLEVVAATAQAEHHYEAKKDDFYPVERPGHTPGRDSEKPPGRDSEPARGHAP